MKLNISKKNILLAAMVLINVVLLVFLLFFLGQLAIIAQQGNEAGRRIKEYKDAKRKVRNFDSSLVLKQELEFKRSIPVEGFDKSMDSLAAIKGFIAAAAEFGVGEVSYSPAKQKQALIAGSTTLNVVTFTVKFSCEYNKVAGLLQKLPKISPQMTIRKLKMKRKLGNLAYVGIEMDLDSYTQAQVKK